MSLSSVMAQVTLSATGGTPTGTFATISDAFTAINAGTYTGSIDISIDANVTEPLAPVALLADGQGTTSYGSVFIHPSAVVVVSGATNAGSGVINFDGADNVSIDGSIVLGGTSRDLTIQNISLISQANVAAIRLIGRTTLGLGVNHVTIKNCVIIGNTPGNDGNSGSTVTSSYGIYAGSNTATTMSNTGGSADYDNLIIQNNLVKSAYVGVHVYSVTGNTADTVMIVGNTIGSATAIERIGNKGVSCSFLTESVISGNIVFNIKSTNSVNVAGIELGGIASTNNMINKNEVYDIFSLNTGGYGSYGINISAGTNSAISNNVIHGIHGTNYNSTSTIWHPFGIRLAGGTGHSVYYNSVNLYGDHTLGTGTETYSAALIVTGTAITGLTIRNNIFNNKHTSAIATTGHFLGVWFPAGYDFVNVTLNNNAYTVSNDSKHFVGRVGTTNYVTLNDWKVISQVNNATNDDGSQPVPGNSVAPFTSNINLTIPAATATLIESGGFEIASIGLPNTDFTGGNRPAGTGTAPDMGAYEFEGTATGDFYLPILSSIIASPIDLCTPIDHTIEVTATDNVGVTTVTLNYNYAGVAQTPITMVLNTGNGLSGTWSGIIPAASANNITVTYSIVAADTAGNVSSVLSGTSYVDAYLTVLASPDVTINTNTTTTVSAASNDPSQQIIVFSEIVQYNGGTGAGTYPAYIPTTDNDFVELTNISDVTVDLSGFVVTIAGGVNNSYTIPSGVTLAPSGVLVLAFAGTASDPANFYYGMNLGTTTSSGVQNGYTLKNQNGVLLDAIATDGYTFNVASGVTASDWSGTIPSSSGLAGVRRTGSDSNTAADWAVAGTGNIMNVSVFNTGLNTVTVPPAGYAWTPSGATTSSVLVGPYATAGTYTHYVSYDDGTCTATDSVNVFVIIPTTPVADFVADQLIVGALQMVTLTDLSTNIPDTWNWVISPATFNYLNGTSATSQNPEVEFTAAGLYDVTLTASNAAGTDDEIKLGYIQVNLVYCNPGATSTSDTDIGNVTFAGINNGVATPTVSNPAAIGTYSDFYPTVPAGNVQQGATYPLSITQMSSGATFYTAYAHVFIDFNQDGTFDPITELVFNGGPASLANPTISGGITIPATAMLGSTRMRVMLKEGSVNTITPCETFTWGETEDYMIDIAAGTNCSGLPAAASTVANDSSVCVNDPFTLSLDNLYQDIGITYQWQSSSDGVTFTDIVGATNPTYSTSQSDTTYYQAIVTCTNSSLTITTTSVKVEMNPFIDCYCTPGATSVYDLDIGNVTFAGINNGSATPTLNNPTANGTYSDFTAITPGNVQQGGSYPISVSQITEYATIYAAYLNVFVDLNHDGVFDPITERLFSDGSTSQANPTISGTLTIPATAMLGLTRVRVMLNEGGNSSDDPCGLFFYGETEDYLVNIALGTNCSGAPAMANTVAADSSVCTGSPINLSLDYLYQDMGITYQWQSSADGITFTDIVGATSPTYSTSQTDETYYQAVITCANSMLSTTSTVVDVVMNTFVDCYCPIAVSYAADSDIGNVTFGTLNNGVATPMLNNPLANGTYSDFTALAPQDYAVGTAFPMSVTQYTAGGTFYSAYVNVFIDYNQDGIFDPVTERVLNGPTAQATPTVSGTVTIPTGIPSGLTRMRVMLNESGNATSDPCGDFFYGEVEDYIINIGCPVLPAPTATSMSVCSGGSAVLNATASSSGTLAWYDAAAAGNELITGTTYTTPGLTSTTSYWVEETVNSCPSPRTEVVVTVNTVNVGVTVSGIQMTSNSLTGTFKWIDCGNGNALIPGETGLQYTPTVNGSYAVIVTEGSCVDTSACIVINSVGIESATIDGQSFNVYPNPSTGMVNWTVANTTSSNLVITLTDVQGKVVYVETVDNVQSNYSNKVDLSELAKGIYYVKFKAGEAVQVQKLVIE